jgi:DNA repair protein RecN (Recombination protein N)
MLIGLSIRDVVLIESLDLAIGEGLTALTGETGAGKSIILDALGLATGARADAGLVRRGAAGHASATAMFALTADHPAFAYLDEKGLDYGRDEDLVLRRQLSPDGRSRAFVNDQATSVGVLKDLGALLLEVHGQHETVGLLDPKTHRNLLDAFGSVSVGAVGGAWSAWRAAREKAEALRDLASRAAAETEELTLRLSELDRLDPREGEEDSLAEERALLSSAEKVITDVASAQDALGSDFSGKLAQAYRALERARDRALQAGAPADGAAMTRLQAACDAVDRALVEAQEASAAIDTVAESFEFEPDRLEKAEERLFALRGMARKLNILVQDLPAKRAEFAARLQAIETSEDALKAADAEAAEAREAYLYAAEALSAERRAAGDALAKAVEAELAPLKLEKARFRVAVEPLAEDRAGPTGLDRIAFEISTNPGAPFGPMEAIASGGELARFALALKAALAGRGGGPQPLMIFDEVDQGVGGAVADAVGLRLKRLAKGSNGIGAQVLVVTHSAQVAARGDAHWRISKSGDDTSTRTKVEPLSPAEREEEIARMLSGAEVTEAARAAARALIA